MKDMIIAQYVLKTLIFLPYLRSSLYNKMLVGAPAHWEDDLLLIIPRCFPHKVVPFIDQEPNNFLPR